MDEPIVTKIGSCTDKGVRRQVNQDSLALPPADLPAEVLARKGSLYILADGIGGHRAGKTASDLTVRVVMEQYYADPSTDVSQSLTRAIQSANAEVHRLAQEPAYAKMGTTVVAAVVQGRRLTVAHVGDSRAYLVQQDRIEALTGDHTWVAEQLRSGVLTPEQARQHAQRHVLLRSLGSESQVAVDVSQITLRPGDTVLLCSDGLWEQVEPGELQAAVASLPPQNAGRQLVDLANQRGGPDNISVVIIQVGAEEVQPAWSRAAGSVATMLASLRVRFSALPAKQRLVAGIVAAVLLLAALVCVTAFFLRRPLPSVPPVEIAPVRYTVLAGDTPAAIAGYFRTSAGSLPATLTPGEQVPVLPGEPAIFFSGQVLSVEQHPNSVTLQVANREERYEVEADFRTEGVLRRDDVAPQEGDTVSVYGFPIEDIRIDAWVVDVWTGSDWQSWYQRQTESDVWLYTAFHEHLLGAPEPDLEGRQALVRGRWMPTATFTRFIWDPQDLFILEGGAYASWLPPTDRQSLPERVLATAGAPAVEQAPSPEPTLTPSGHLEIYGRVDTNGLNIRPDPSTAQQPKGELAYDATVQVLCAEQGESINGNSSWYQIVLEADQTGYVWAGLVRLPENLQESDIPPCEH